MCYYEGRGVARDMEQAVAWYRKAAEQGDPRAQYNLGVCYELGQGVKQDQEKAATWYYNAAKHGLREAKEVLRSMDS